MIESQKPSAISHQPKLKVCGLTRIGQIQELILINTDFLGFIFYEKSPRYVLNHLTLEEISMIGHQAKVGVFVNATLEKLAETADQAKLDFIQLHGDEDKDFIAELRKMINPETGIIKVIRIGKQTPDELQRIINDNGLMVDYLLFDTDSQAFGGTGKTFDWNLLNKIKIPLPYFLSGGISEDNINNTAMLHQKPFAIDINSKFEIEPGIKDVGKIINFEKKIR
ncbi:phosphoribosylanthranilate isomerase [Chryseobacterium hagamense]|uniref:N-(5'-phosphoribosyl)anthranilate isomerase n=1 Tax=Chryseobacterium hagamense TaxID=395935 RepID=A0A511YRB0_9FLAO|nr:phosphoribosylanthranilate isomerase [Chryseobacterium hagamense]GEN77733.1 N-(5'-phosphoribosyl)anthranilate isomerase [Chryseobacterium hagamense]